MSLEVNALWGTHGNEPLSMEVARLLEAEPNPLIKLWCTHPELWEQPNVGKRFLGTSQIQDHYPGDPNGDPEDRAAAATMSWLGDKAQDPHAIVYDIHDTNLPGHNSLYHGFRVPKLGMAAARILGFQHSIVCTQSFHDHVPSGICIDRSVPDGRLVDAARLLASALGSLTSWSSEELHGLYGGQLPLINYYRKIEVISVDNSGQLLEPVRELEKIPPERFFGRTAIPRELREYYGIPDSADVAQGSWAHRNMSPQVRELGFYGGAPRRLYFGDILVRMPRPREQDGWLLFDEILT